MKTPFAPELQIVQWGRWRIAWATISNASKINDLLKSEAIDGVGVSPHHGFDGKDLAFLRELESLQGVVMPFPETYDCSELVGLKSIRFLTLGPKKTVMDYSLFPSLVDLRINWNARDRLPKDFQPLESLYIKGYSPKSKDLNMLPSFKYLEFLELVQGSFEKLDGIERILALKQAQFSYCTKLIDIRALRGSCLELVDFEKCKKVNDLNPLTGCQRLKTIRLGGIGNLQSISFLNACPVIEEFRFVDIDVVDGDMSPLLRLKKVGFIGKRHYSHTQEEVRSYIASVSAKE